jgi:hypothetical protein
MSVLPGRLLAVAAWNAALAVTAIAALAPELPEPVRMGAVGVLVLVLPGVAWLGAFRRALDPPRLALAVFGVSSLVTGAALLATALGEQDPSRLRLLAVIAAAGSAGLLLFGLPRRLASGAPWLVLAGMTVCGFALASGSALHVVAPVPEPEMEVRGTAWGLAATGRPWFQGDRESPFALARPLLLHALVAESLLVSGEIGVTERSYRSARANAVARSAGLPLDTAEIWREDRTAFLAEPTLLPTRAVPALLFAATLALLFELGRRLTGSRSAGLAGAALFALSPGTVVCAGSAGMVLPAGFAMLTTALLTEAPLGRRPEVGWIASGAALGALLDQGTGVLALGATLFAALRAGLAAWRAPSRRLRALRDALDRGTLALVLGFVAGAAIWWTYGLWVGGAGFVQEQLRAPGAEATASLAAQWADFSYRTGHGLLPVALPALCVWALAAGTTEPRRALAGWGLLAAATGFLASALPALVAGAVALAWTALPRRPRTGGEPLRAVPRSIAWTAALLLTVGFAYELSGSLGLLRDLHP